MKYLAAHFEIACMDDMMQIARDLLMDVAGEAGFESFEDTERGVDGYVQEQLFDRQLPDDGIASFPLDGVSIVYNINKVEDQDWNAVWEEQGFEPIDIDHRVVVYDAKGEVPQHDAGAVMIGIDARQAFGTGTHETTQMIIASLLDMQLEGKSVLDCGCGTGILSIAAASSNGISGMATATAPDAMPVLRAISPQSRPMTSTTLHLAWDSQVSRRRSTHSSTVFIAVSKPTV